ncbi:hypothetical protein BK026_02390 [Alteromonas sp. V450]|uniref:hypothetical protein n=1 Tax=Alteromonas sp. V450 TaxID=1912139 RepID=UPI0008FF3D0C|nr:hypothetical protein [Alteromonas sp. V450]OJF67719.1 hypothetical protein BK026_02390 [Alteromonas sp. V450]
MRYLKTYLSIGITTLFCITACSQDELQENADMGEKKVTVTQPIEKAPKALKAEPTSQAELEDKAQQSTTLKGTIIFKELEGGFYAFISEQGERFTLYNLGDEYKKNGLIAEIKGIKDPNAMTFTQFGTVLHVTEVKILDTSKLINDK